MKFLAMNKVYSPTYMHPMKFDIEKRVERKRMGNSLFFSVTLGVFLLFSSFATMQAATPSTKQTKNTKAQSSSKQLVANSTKEEVAIEKPRLLFAESSPIKREIEIIDSLVFAKEIEEEEEEFGIPAEDIYQTWNNQYVNPYKNIEIPDSFAVDLTSVVMPIDDEVIRITSKYGFRRTRMHRGIDLKVQVGDTIRSVCDGRVRVKQFERRGYGYYLVLRHSNGLETVYGHLSKFLVEENDNVKAGQAIALGGNTGRSTGSHLHFETRLFGEDMDPANLFDFDNKVMHVDTYVFNKNKVNNKYTGKGTDKITYHRVKSGETLSVIARKHGVTVSQLCRLNKITTRTIIRAGRTLRCS